MTRDMRDPQKLGEVLAELRDDFMGVPLTEIVNYNEHRLKVPDYTNNEGPIEKYGDPAEVNPLFITVRVR